MLMQVYVYAGLCLCMKVREPCELYRFNAIEICWNEDCVELAQCL